MNSIVFRKPTHIYCSDSCPHGSGGYSHKGWAWRWYLPENLRFRALNNLLDYLAAIISPWVDILAGQLGHQDCATLMTNSTTAEGWLRKSNFTELGESPTQASVRIEAARKFATLMIEFGIKLYSQWFRGPVNEVADALSRDNDRSDEELTHVIKTFCSSQVPSHFKILQLPSKIISWLTVLLLKLPVNERYNEPHTISKIRRGDDGRSTWNQSESRTTYSSKTSLQNNDTCSSERLPWLSEKPDFLRSTHDPLVASTVSSTIQYLCSTFRENGYPNPTLNEDGQFAFILQRELRPFKNLNPPDKHQAAVPMSVISAINKRNSSELKRATAQLTTLGIFFAMRSCEYLKVHQSEQRRTGIIRL